MACESCVDSYQKEINVLRECEKLAVLIAKPGIAMCQNCRILLTWNCTHIANPAQLPVMRGLCSAKRYRLPELVTPFELMEVLP